MSAPRMTNAQAEFLDRIRRCGGAAFIHGAGRVRIARNLERAGLVTLMDNGRLRINGRGDGERWWVEIRGRS